MPSFINTGNIQDAQPHGWFKLFDLSLIQLRLLFCRPDMVDMSRVSAQTNRSNLEHAFCVAEQLGVPRLLDPEGECG